MSEAVSSNSISSSTSQVSTQSNGQVNAPSVSVQEQNTSIFSQSKGNNNNINQSNTNSGGTGGLSIFGGNVGGEIGAIGFDNTSIFSGYHRGSQYALYSKKDADYDVPKLTQEDIANQKGLEGPKRTNPKAYNIDMTPKANPYEAFRNPDLQEKSFTESITDAIAGLFGSKKSS